LNSINEIGWIGRDEPTPGSSLLFSPVWTCYPYALDCLPDMSAEQVAERTEPLVRQLRKARPETPILLVEDRTFTSAPFLKGSRDAHAARRAAYRKAYEKLLADGVKGLAYLEGEALLGDDGEGATDGSHPNDLGMARYADAYEKEMITGQPGCPVIIFDQSPEMQKRGSSPRRSCRPRPKGRSSGRSARDSSTNDAVLLGGSRGD